MLKNLIPKFVKTKLNHYLVGVVAAQEAAMPVVPLAKKHLQHTLLLDDRTSFLELMPKNAVVAEVGVDKGGFSEQILQITNPQKLHLIDAWDTERYHDGLALGVQVKFRELIASGKIELHRGYSTDWLPKFPDQYFDWVYIDTNHSYETTAQELEICKNKVKPNGIIAGHDYTLGLPGHTFRYGVVEAVNEFCVKNDWELLYLTHEPHRLLSYALRKIS